MTLDEKRIWQILEGRIDGVAYRSATPLKVRQIGKVTRVRPRYEQVQWENGKKESVRLEQMPAEFAAYKPGQFFRALVERDPTDFRLIRVQHVEKMRAPSPISSDEMEELVSQIPASDSLPDGDWD